LLFVLSFACVLATSTLIAQRGPAPDALVKETVTVKLVIDPGLDSFLRAKFPRPLVGPHRPRVGNQPMAVFDWPMPEVR